MITKGTDDSLWHLQQRAHGTWVFLKTPRSSSERTVCRSHHGGKPYLYDRGVGSPFSPPCSGLPRLTLAHSSPTFSSVFMAILNHFFSASIPSKRLNQIQPAPISRVPPIRAITPAFMRYPRTAMASMIRTIQNPVNQSANPIVNEKKV